MMYIELSDFYVLCGLLFALGAVAMWGLVRSTADDADYAALEAYCARLERMLSRPTPDDHFDVTI